MGRGCRLPDVWAEQVAGGVAVLASHAHRSAGEQPTKVLMPVERGGPPSSPCL